MSAAAAPPDLLPADLQDQILRICTEIGCAGPMIMMMSFPSRLDEARLARAARLMLDAEPILGFRFDPDPERPVWRRRNDLDDRTWCVTHTVADLDDLVRRLLTPTAQHLEENFLVHLVHRPDGDTVLIWMSHLIADGFATSQCAALLAAIYTRLGTDPDYRPERNDAPRDSQQWMRDITFRDVLRIIRRDVTDLLQGRGTVHGFHRDYPAFQKANPPTGADFVRHRIPTDIVAAIDRAAASRGCTRNDLLSAAFLRAFADMAPQGPSAKAKMGMTVDLRTYAPAQPRHAIYSMVGITYVAIGPDLGATFDDTLRQVTAVVRRQKKALMGAANPLYVRFLERMSFGKKRAMVEKILRRTMRRPMAPTFSNGGRLRAARLRFDGTAPTDAGFVVYPCPLPLFLVGAMEYEGTVSLTACFQPDDLPRERVRLLLERMQREIPIDTAVESAARVKEIA